MDNGAAFSTAAHSGGKALRAFSTLRKAPMTKDFGDFPCVT